MVDFGYDISDFKDVDHLFGSLQDMKDLIKEMHELGNVSKNNIEMNYNREKIRPTINFGLGAESFE